MLVNGGVILSRRVTTDLPTSEGGSMVPVNLCLYMEVIANSKNIEYYNYICHPLYFIALNTKTTRGKGFVNLLIGLKYVTFPNI